MKVGRLEKFLGNLLLAEVLTSLAVLTLAIFFYAVALGSEVELSESFRVSSPTFFDYVMNLGSKGLGPEGLMTAGLVILIFTPYSRVLTSIVYFAAERNIKFLLITLFVFAVLTTSLLTH
ncbi:MAG: DUF1634 domain-containing protein [Candidatus Caldarchaeum sp.]